MKFFRFNSLQSRLLFVFLSLFIIVGFLAFISIRNVFERSARRQIEHELQFSASVVDKLISNQLEAQSQAVSVLSKDYAFQQAFSTNELETVSSAMESLVLRCKADLIMLVSTEDHHKVMVDIPKSNLAGRPFPYLELITLAEDESRSQSAFITLHDQLFSVIITPILAPETIAWFCIGFRLDNRFLLDLQKLIPSDLSLVELKPRVCSRVFASTLPPSAWNLLSEFVSQFSGKSGISPLQIGKERFLVQARCLDEKRGVWLLIQQSLEQALQPFYHLQTILLNIGLVGLLITFFGVVAISRSVSRPVRELAEKSREVAKGRYDQQVAIDLEDEIGELGHSFNRMIKGLAERDLLAIQNELLQENARLRDQVEHIMRHDLKTPLSAFLSIPALLKRRKDLPPDVPATLDMLIKSGYRMLEMINKSLDLFRMESGTYTFNPVEVNILPLVYQIGWQLKDLTATKNLTLSVLCDGLEAKETDHFGLSGEETLFYSLLANLAKNAIEASPDHEVVTFRLERTSFPGLSIHNKGVIPPEIRDRFMTKFVTHGKSSGTGIGGYSAKLMAETLGGKIAFTSEATTGTTIHVQFPPQPVEKKETVEEKARVL